MADNIISQYFSKSDGSTIATDNDLKSLSTGTVVKNINSKEFYKKIAVNVFDKQNDFITAAEVGRKYTPKSEAVKSINGDGSSTTITYQMADGTKKSFITKDTTYSAGTGLTLNGNSFNVNIPNTRSGEGSTDGLIMLLDKSGTFCRPSTYDLTHIIKMINESGIKFGDSTLVYTYRIDIGKGELVSGSLLYSNTGDREPSGRKSGTWLLESDPSFHHSYETTETKPSQSGSNTTTTVTHNVYFLYAKQFLG